MSKHTWLFCSLATFAVALLAGCGTSGPPPVPAGLAGNWLIQGSLPVIPLSYQATFLNQALTLDVSGNQVSGAGWLGIACGISRTGSIGNLALSPASVASNGTFTLQSTPPIDAPTVQLQAVAPISGASSWGGTYTITSGTCLVTKGPFTATPIQPLTGTYTGSAEFEPSLRPVSDNPNVPPVTITPVTIKATFQQGGMNPATGTISNLILTGTITVQGLSCFTTGTMTAMQSPGNIQGGVFTAPFKMNDGSLMTLDGRLLDTGAIKLGFSIGPILGGACDYYSAVPNGANGYDFELDKQ